MYICFIPVLACFIALIWLKCRAVYRCCPGHQSNKRARDRFNEAPRKIRKNNVAGSKERVLGRFKEAARKIRKKYSGAHWKKHHDGMKTSFVVQHVFGLRAVADHSTDRIFRAYWQFLTRNHDTLAPFLAPHDPVSFPLRGKTAMADKWMKMNVIRLGTYVYFLSLSLSAFLPS